MHTCTQNSAQYNTIHTYIHAYIHTYIHTYTGVVSGMSKLLSGSNDAGKRGMRNVYEMLFGNDVDAAYKIFDTNQDGKITW